jgi:hypothetical protein
MDGHLRRVIGDMISLLAEPQATDLDRAQMAFDLLDLAQHIDASAKVGDAAAVATLTEAGRQSAQRAPATAARWFSGALRLLPESAAADQ